jgi:hypothetical protein
MRSGWQRVDVVEHVQSAAFAVAEMVVVKVADPPAPSSAGLTLSDGAKRLVHAPVVPLYVPSNVTGVLRGFAPARAEVPIRMVRLQAAAAVASCTRRFTKALLAVWRCLARIPDLRLV